MIGTPPIAREVKGSEHNRPRKARRVCDFVDNRGVCSREIVAGSRAVRFRTGAALVVVSVASAANVVRLLLAPDQSSFDAPRGVPVVVHFVVAHGAAVLHRLIAWRDHGRPLPAWWVHANAIVERAIRLREVELGSRLSHPGIVTVFDSGMASLGLGGITPARLMVAESDCARARQIINGILPII